MAAIREIVREWADEIRGGIAWVIVWKNGRSWNAMAVWPNSDDTFEPEDLEQARKILKQDSNAVMLNGYYCGHFSEDMTVTELAAGIRWHYENGYNTLNGSIAFSQESEDSKENTKQKIERTTRTLLKVHEDVITVPEVIRKMAEEYAAEGYQVERLSSMNFKIVLSDGWVHIFWEDGKIWQEIIEEAARNEREIQTIVPQEKDIASQKALIRQDSMDKLSLGFCEKLYVVNGFVTDIVAGHITRIGRETNLARMPPEIGTAGSRNNKLYKKENDQKGTGIQSGRLQKTQLYYSVSDAKNQ